MNSRRLIASSEAQERDAVQVQSSTLEGAHVRFGSKADICSAQAHVRFTPNSDRKSRLPRKVMSALPPKADMCSAVPHVRFGPQADILPFATKFRSAARTPLASNICD